MLEQETQEECGSSVNFKSALYISKVISSSPPPVATDWLKVLYACHLVPVLDYQEQRKDSGCCSCFAAMMQHTSVGQKKQHPHQTGLEEPEPVHSVGLGDLDCCCGGMLG
jgi:hypothetical protein